MSLVNVLNMVVLDNPTAFGNPFQFEITFECLSELDDDLEWKVVYVGSAEDTTQDQTLDEVMVGPVPVGVNKFVLQADAPEGKDLIWILNFALVREMSVCRCSTSSLSLSLSLFLCFCFCIEYFTILNERASEQCC
jgi:hypothetical protein